MFAVELGLESRQLGSRSGARGYTRKMCGRCPETRVKQGRCGTLKAEEMPVAEINSIIISLYNVLVLWICKYPYDIVWQACRQVRTWLHPSSTAFIPLLPLFLLPCWALKTELRDVLDDRSTVELHLIPTDVDSSISLHGP